MLQINYVFGNTINTSTEKESSRNSSYTKSDKYNKKTNNFSNIGKDILEVLDVDNNDNTQQETDIQNKRLETKKKLIKALRSLGYEHIEIKQILKRLRNSRLRSRLLKQNDRKKNSAVKISSYFDNRNGIVVLPVLNSKNLKKYKGNTSMIPNTRNMFGFKNKKIINRLINNNNDENVENDNTNNWRTIIDSLYLILSLDDEEPKSSIRRKKTQTETRFKTYKKNPMVDAFNQLENQYIYNSTEAENYYDVYDEPQTEEFVSDN